MIQIKITPDIITRAKKKAASVGNLQGSITGSLSNVVGAIGEIIVEDYSGGEPVNNKDFDLVLENRRVDVKTKRCNTTPSPNYDCSVAAHGSKQDCDSYVFVRILTDHSKAWILGEVSKDNFYKKATRYQRGDIDPANGFKFRADCYNLAIQELENVNVKKTTQG
tara:strand:+ start:399 stop:893 length:495 start_codon:yes stop_codon:yes gene_type:complete